MGRRSVKRRETAGKGRLPRRPTQALRLATEFSYGIRKLANGLFCSADPSRAEIRLVALKVAELLSRLLQRLLKNQFADAAVIRVDGVSVHADYFRAGGRRNVLAEAQKDFVQFLRANSFVFHDLQYILFGDTSQAPKNLPSCATYYA